MLATFGSLKSAIADQLINDDLNSQIGRCINQSVHYYNQRYSFWFNEASDTETLTIGQQALPMLPSSWNFERPDVSFVIVRDTITWPIKKISLAAYKALDNGRTGIPTHYAFDGTDFLSYPYPDVAYTLQRYWSKSYNDMSEDEESNDWLTYAERLIEAKATADIYLKYRHEPEMADIFFRLAQDELAQLNSANNQREASGSLSTQPLINHEGDYHEYLTRW